MKRFVVHLTVWALALAGALAVLLPGSASAATPAPGTYVAVAPARLLDTRTGVGAKAAKVAASGTVTVQVTGRGGVPAAGVSAVVLNVTAVAPTASGFVTVYGPGSRPTVSNLNFVAGQTVPNLVVVPVSATGTVKLFNGSKGTTHLLADVAGYYRSGAPTASGAFGSLAPARLLDTRTGVGAKAAKVAASGTVTVQVTGRGGVPAAGVSAVVLNVTAVAPTASGFVTVYGPGSRPTVSNLNFVAGQTVPNLVVVPVSATGTVKLFNGSKGTTHLLADVAGYYRSGAPTASGAFGSLAPARLLDTRTGVGAKAAKVAASGTVTVQVTGRGGVPAAGVSAVVLNVTAVAPTASGFVTVYGPGSRPTVSNLNFVAGQTVPNLVVVPVSATGTVKLFNGSKGTTHLLADVAGYYRSDTVAGTTAVLSVNDSTTGTAKTSVGGFEPVFIVAGSTAAAGATIVSGSVNYGDGTVQSFTGPVDTWDPNHVYAAPGTRTVTLQVTDSAGNSDSDVVVVTVFAAPTATISSTGGAAGSPAGVKVATVTPANTVITDYQVDYGDGTGLVFGAGAPPATLTHTYDAVGSFTVAFSAFNDADGIANATTHVAVAQPPVTALSVTGQTETTISLGWTNPTNAGFTGVTIRRSAGAVPPADPTAGVSVAVPLSKTAVSFTDTGLTAGTQYSYAVFAQDAAPHFSIAKTVTETTGTPPGVPPVAALSINNSTGATAKASLNGFLARVDLTGTRPATGQTFTQVSLRYGDGTTVQFTGQDPSQWDADHAYLTTGVKIATLTVTDSGGGTATTAVTVTVFPQPTATITGPATAAVNAVTTFGVTAATPTGTTFTSWDLSVDGIQIAESGFGAPPATIDWPFDAPGTYNVTLSVFNDADGDATSNTVTVVVS